MLAFIIPFKPKRNSANWASDSENLKNTLLSILEQTNTAFQVMVILHDMPLDPLLHEQVTYSRFPGAYCTYDQLEDGVEQLKGNAYLKERDVEYLFDQGRKQMYGANIAIEQGFEYIMSVDADDLVSKHLVQYIMQNSQPGIMGWFVDKGFFYIKNENIFIRRPYAMNVYNGSTNIVHKNYIPHFDIAVLRLGDINFFSSHAYLATRLKESYGKVLRPLPFYAIVYVVTDQNWRASSVDLKGKSLIQQLKFQLRKVLFTKRLYKEFYIK
jgi:hypothetical protein